MRTSFWEGTAACLNNQFSIMNSSSDSLTTKSKVKDIVNQKKTRKPPSNSSKKNLFNTLRNCFQMKKSWKLRLKPRTNVSQVPANSIHDNETTGVQDSMRLLKLSEIENYYGIGESNLNGDNLETQRSDTDQMNSCLESRNFSDELYDLSRYGWYWGSIPRLEAEAKLQDSPDGTFLVRDSLAEHYLLSVTFRCCGKTYHCRIEHNCGMFRLFGDKQYSSIGELIEQSMMLSRDAVYCFSRPRSPTQLALPVRLTHPYSRFMQVRSLQYLCRVVIRQCTRIDNINKLPLPDKLRQYLMEAYF